jgi:hypothetical protein
VLILAGACWAALHRTALTPKDVAAAKRGFGLPGLSDYQFAVSMVWFLGAVLMAWLVGLISLFLLWRPGVYIFLAGVCAIWVVQYLRHRLTAGGFYSGVEMGLEVVIVAFALFGPAKHLFQRQGAE